MLSFPEKFYKKEIKWDFPIGELRKRSWAAQLEVLKVIADICEKYQLDWYVYWGTLIGAVRHKGFIPWDDDIDIALRKEDYIRFLEVAPSELPSEYCILNSYTEKEYTNYFSRITNRHAIDYSIQGMRRYHGFPFVAGIDIFPLYYIPENSEEAEMQKQLLALIGQIVDLCEYRATLNGQEQEEEYHEIEETIRDGLTALEELTGFCFETNRSLQNQLTILYDQICRMYNAKESRAVTAFPIYMKNGYEVEGELIERTVILPFENMNVRAPIGYDSILRKTFQDYMTPVRGKGSHKDLFYKSQMELLEKYICKMVNEDLRENDALREKQKQAVYEQTENVRSKKTVLFCCTMSEMLSYDGFAIEKLRYVLNTFCDKEEIVLWWRPCVLDTPSVRFLKEMIPDFLREYRELIEEYRRQGIGILDETGNVAWAVENCDAYYGDPGETAELFAKTGRPMMYQNYEII